jgi:phospholipase/carboxylesterase
MNYTNPHKHIYTAPLSPSGNIDTLILLHGTGGNEHDLVPLAQQMIPGCGILGIRGNVSENGMPRYFRRLSEGVFDLDDLRLRAMELASFIKEATQEYGINLNKACAVGYSNGANIASAVHFLSPGLLKHSIHFRPMVPLVPEAAPDLSGIRVLLTFGAFDPLMPPGEKGRLTGLFEQYGSSVTSHIEQTGHQLVGGDIEAAVAWINS